MPLQGTCAVVLSLCNSAATLCCFTLHCLYVVVVVVDGNMVVVFDEQECRCFTSSLLEITSINFQPSFPVRGLCYRCACVSVYATRGANSTCSALMHVIHGSPPTPPRVCLSPLLCAVGVCINARSNCFKPDYLQIAVMDPFLLKFLWFKCPTDGGKLHIPK